MVVSVIVSVKSKTFISYLEEETEADPLVVFDISSFVGINGFVDAGMGNVDTNPFPKGTGYGVCGVNPAIGIEHIFWDVLSMHTVNGITHILSSGHNQRKSQHKGH